MTFIEQRVESRTPAGPWAVAPSGADAGLDAKAAARPVRREVAGASYYLACPPVIGPDTRLLVSVHGISRNARQHARQFGRIATRLNWVVMAPLFDEADFPDYQRLGLGKRERAQRADRVLNAMLDDLARLTGMDCSRFCLFGFSGGGQFAHRYALLHPERVLRLGVAAAGFYTFPDPRVPYPRGLKVKDAQACRWLLEATLCIPTAVFVGERDNGRDNALRTGSRIDRQQGRNRVERAANWVVALRRAVAQRGLDTPVTLTRLPGCGHDFGQCVRKGALNYEAMAFFTQPGLGEGALERSRLEPNLLRFMV